MRFSDSEIQFAAKLRGAGLIWDPQPGHYVFDIDGVIKAGSPFQAGVYLIDSPNAIETAVGGEESLRGGFAWLPTWEDARAWLREAGVADKRVVQALSGGVKEGSSDLEAMYSLILEVLEARREEVGG